VLGVTPELERPKPKGMLFAPTADIMASNSATKTTPADG
jgi:hypothetical protein